MSLAVAVTTAPHAAALWEGQASRSGPARPFCAAKEAGLASNGDMHALACSTHARNAAALALRSPERKKSVKHPLTRAARPGGSLGPEAALLSLCGSTSSYLARRVFGCRGQRLRNCALMGMTAGLAAFFGVALGGAPGHLLAPWLQCLSAPVCVGLQAVSTQRPPLVQARGACKNAASSLLCNGARL